VQQRVQSFVGLKPHISAYAAIASGRSTTRNKLFTSERGHTVSAVTGLDPDFCPIDKHDVILSNVLRECGLDGRESKAGRVAGNLKFKSVVPIARSDALDP
jgi:hypothetical protein